MSVESCRKIKAAVLILMLAVAEARNIDVLSKTLPRWRSSGAARKGNVPEQQAKLFAEQIESMKTDSALKHQVDIVAKHVEALMADSKIREQAQQIAKEVETMVNDQKLQEQTKRLAKQVEAMTANPHLQEQAKLIVEQVGAMTTSPKAHEQAKAFVKQVEAMKANPNLKRQAKLFDEELEAMMAHPNFQLIAEQMKATTTDTTSQANQFIKHLNSLTADPTFQAQAKRVAEHAGMIMADPAVEEQAKVLAEQMASMKPEPTLQEQMKRVAEQVEALKVDPELQAQTKLIAQQMDEILTDTTLQKQANRISEHMRVMMADPNLQERAQLIAKQVESMSLHPESKYTKNSRDTMIDSLVNNLSDDFFDRALKVSQPPLGLLHTRHFPEFTTRSAWRSTPKRAAPIMAQKDKVSVVAEREAVTATMQREQKAITVKAEAAEEGGLVQDGLAGLTVAFSLLSKAIACSTIVGVSPLVGLWSAVVMGVAAPLLGSRPGVISGTAAVVTVPLSQLVAARGTEYIAPAILLASLFSTLFGVLRLSRFTVLVTDAVLSGFLNALGLILFESQKKVFTKAPDFNSAVIIAAVCVVVVQGLPKFTKAIPSSLAGLIVATGVGIAFDFKLEKLVDKAGPATFAGGLSSLPTPIDFGKVFEQLTNPSVLEFVVPAAGTIAFISILETLLAGRVVDELKSEPICTFTPDGKIVCETDEEEDALDTPTKTVIGLGVGQFISACLGGFGGCGLIPQTVLNIKSGGGGAASSAAYAASMAAFVLLLAPAVGQITSPALSGIFLTVAYDTVQWEATANTVKAALPGNAANPNEARIELLALVTAGVVCYKVDAALGIVAGVAIEQALRKVVPGVDDDK